ncbi:Smr/MutS family protein [Variovorax sp. DAIF25]|uniref:Smr/MutS family protein n=1 Tax=Variovorax sp. DAIF25 TaxID=3080983 RepID=UPI003D6C4C2D
MAAARPHSPGAAPAPAPKSLKNLADLKQVQRQLAETREREAAEAAARAVAERKRAAEKDLFARAVGATEPLRQKTRTVPLAPEPPAPIPVQHQLDEQRVLRESLSDEFDVTTLLDVDDAMSFRRPGIGTDVTARLRKGDWTIQAQVDLHGLRSDEAREALGGFIRNAHKQGLRCVRVVHGKGLGSPGKQPVLKTKTQRWLIQKNEVLAFVQAKPAEGGAGALVVLLAPVKR